MTTPAARITSLRHATSSALRRGPVRRAVQWRRHQGLDPADVFLASYPKSGNTWLRHLVTIALTGRPTEWRGDLEQVSTRIGLHAGLKPTLSNGGRLIKTHEQWRPHYGRSVLLVRHPLDVLMSEWSYQANYSKRFPEYRGSFEVFVKRFAGGTTNSYGSWDAHTRSWLDLDDHSDTLVLRFEDLRSDPGAVLSRVLTFIGHDDHRHVDLAVADTTLESMKSKEARYWAARNADSPGFVRSGGSGDWAASLTAEQVALVTASSARGLELAGYSLDGSR